MSEADQHLDEIYIPVIEIKRGWAVEDVETIEECDDAYAVLMAAVAEIEFELDMKQAGHPRFEDPTWKPRAARALKYKKAALQLLNFKRARLDKARKREQHVERDRALLEHIIANLPEGKFQSLCRSFHLKHGKDDG